MVAAGPVAIDAVEPLIADGLVGIDGLIVNSSGLVQSGGTMSIRGLYGISAERLSSGPDHRPAVARRPDPRRRPCLGRTGHRIRSLGRHHLGLGRCRSRISTVSPGRSPCRPSATSTWSRPMPRTLLKLNSTAGAITATGPVNAGGARADRRTVQSPRTRLASGGTTLLQSANGGVTVAALDSVGLVTAQGRYVDIDSPGALAFADARATAGAVAIDTQGDLSLRRAARAAGCS
jgi:hypothetical protein